MAKSKKTIEERLSALEVSIQRLMVGSLMVMSQQASQVEINVQSLLSSFVGRHDSNIELLEKLRVDMEKSFDEEKKESKNGN
jgi:hypothetical protein